MGGETFVTPKNPNKSFATLVSFVQLYTTVYNCTKLKAETHVSSVAKTGPKREGVVMFSQVSHAAQPINLSARLVVCTRRRGVLKEMKKRVQVYQRFFAKHTKIT